MVTNFNKIKFSLILSLFVASLHSGLSFAAIILDPGGPNICEVDDSNSGGQSSSVDENNRVLSSRGTGQAFGQENSSFAQLRVGFTPSISFPATIEASVAYNGILRGTGGGNNNRGIVKLELSLRDFEDSNEGDIIETVVLLDQEEDGSAANTTTTLVDSVSNSLAGIPTSATFTADLVAGRTYGVVLRLETTGSGGDGVIVAHGLADFSSDDREASLTCIAIVPNLTDSDGDGLFDIWETVGIDLNNNGDLNDPGDLDLPALGADPLHKDIFLEFDWMIGQEPSAAAIQALKQAFAAAPIDAGGIANPDGQPGINLWIDTGNLVESSGTLVGDNLGGGNAIAPLPIADLVTDTDSDGITDFNEVKNNPAQGNFNISRRLAFHYAISAQPGGFGGGWGEVGGNDFIEYNHDPGTIMHELGHNLNLRHGGDETRNCKPNYVSVMNYDNQFGIFQTATGTGQDLDGDGNLDGQIIDYSPPRNSAGRGTAPLVSLIENSLNESLILDSSDLSNRFVFTNSTGSKIQSPLNGDINGDTSIDAGIDGIDWDSDGNTNDINIPANIDTSGSNSRPADCTNATTSDQNDPTTGYNDWDVVALNFLQFGNPDEADRPIAGPLPDLSDRDILIAELNTTDLQIVKTAVSEFEIAVAGQELTYNLVVQNNGPNPATKVQVTDMLPSQTTFISSNGSCVENPTNMLTCDLGELLPGSASSLEIKVKLDADLPCRENDDVVFISNTAQVENLSGADTDQSNNVSTVRTKILCIKYEYAAKVVCGKQDNPKDLSLTRGLYATTVNIHNPNDQELKFFKKLALTIPPKEQRAGQVIPIAVDTLNYDEALAADCNNLEKEAFSNGFPESYIEGFVVIQSPKSLDVTAVYSSAALSKKGRIVGHSSLDIEQIKERIRKQPEIPQLPDLIPTAPFPTGLIVGLPGTRFCSNAPPQGGASRSIQVIVENQGPGLAGASNTTADFYNLGVQVSLPTPALNPSETTNLEFAIPSGCYGPGFSGVCAFRIMVDAANSTGIIDETNEGNNVAESLCVGPAG